MSTFTIKHGEVGFDIMKNGEVYSTGYEDRAAAKRMITLEEKHEWALREAAKDVAKVREILRYNFNLTDAEISKLLLLEAARGQS